VLRPRARAEARREPTREAVAAFGGTPRPDDGVVLEATGDTAAIARRTERHRRARPAARDARAKIQLCCSRNPAFIQHGIGG
jgi:hypothetical protein